MGVGRLGGHQDGVALLLDVEARERLVEGILRAGCGLLLLALFGLGEMDLLELRDMVEAEVEVDGELQTFVLHAGVEELDPRRQVLLHLRLLFGHVRLVLALLLGEEVLLGLLDLGGVCARLREDRRPEEWPETVQFLMTPGPCAAADK
jgi:hypothetical protein